MEEYQVNERKTITIFSVNEAQEGYDNNGEEKEEEDEEDLEDCTKLIEGPVEIAPGLFEERYRYKVVRYRIPEDPVPSIEEDNEYGLLMAERLPNAPPQRITIETIHKFPHYLNQ
jgi:hypothetical protein